MKQQLHGARRQDRLSFVWILDEQGVLIVLVLDLPASFDSNGGVLTADT
jgi:hypothetical protein